MTKAEGKEALATKERGHGKKRKLSDEISTGRAKLSWCQDSPKTSPWFTSKRAEDGSIKKKGKRDEKGLGREQAVSRSNALLGKLT